ncbi:MAG: hypothetical protein ACRDTG_02625, partial [Pseudonocardiaceae bacterium]
MADVLLDHPSWMVNDEGVAYRAVRSGSSIWSVTGTPSVDGDRQVRISQVFGSGTAPVLDVFDPSVLIGIDVVVSPLRAAGPVGRLRNPDVWDAVAASILRQVIRAGQARKLYRVFCHAYGEAVTTPGGEAWMFPVPETVLALPDTEFARLGMAFKRRPLQAAAQAVLEFGPQWATLDPTELVQEVQAVPRIGPWTAGASVADLTNDYALYPFADLAVRTWAKCLAPGR